MKAVGAIITSASHRLLSDQYVQEHIPSSNGQVPISKTWYVLSMYVAVDMFNEGYFQAARPPGYVRRHAAFLTNELRQALADGCKYTDDVAS